MTPNGWISRELAYDERLSVDLAGNGKDALYRGRSVIYAVMTIDRMPGLRRYKAKFWSQAFLHFWGTRICCDRAPACHVAQARRAATSAFANINSMSGQVDLDRYGDERKFAT
jgi:hypothetical protein